MPKDKVESAIKRASGKDAANFEEILYEGYAPHGVAVIVEAKLSGWQDYVALFLFCVIATASYLALEIYAGFRPAQAQAFLGTTRTWIDTHTDQVIIIVSLVLGFWLVANSIYLIVT